MVDGIVVRLLAMVVAATVVMVTVPGMSFFFSVNLVKLYTHLVISLKD